MVAIHPRFEPEMLARLQPMVGNAYGRVAILGDPDLLWGEKLSFGPDVTSVATVQSPQGGAWDCLVSVAQLWNMANLTSLRELLGSERRLFFVEPVAAFGLANRFQRLAKSALQSRYGLDFHCDLPQELRVAGMTPTSVDRFRVRSAVFTFAAGEARVY